MPFHFLSGKSSKRHMLSTFVEGSIRILEKFAEKMLFTSQEDVAHVSVGLEYGPHLFLNFIIRIICNLLKFIKNHTRFFFFCFGPFVDGVQKVGKAGFEDTARFLIKFKLGFSFSPDDDFGNQFGE